MIINYWHMQMHSTNELENFGKYLDWILEHRQFIGLGEQKVGENQNNTFKNDMKANDIVAIKRGSKLVTLLQVSVVLILYRVKMINDERT